jgi:NAD dependent epimerase/dehydratase family enzyme
MPVPGAVARLMVGEVAKYAVTGVRMVPGRAEELGYTFRYPDLDGALAKTLARNS